MREKLRLIVPALTLMVTLVLCCMQPVSVTSTDNSVNHTSVAYESNNAAEDETVSSDMTDGLFAGANVNFVE